MDYRFAIEHFTGEGRSLGQAWVTPDFGPAREWAYFEAVRRGALPLVTAHAGGTLAPVWSDELGPPHLRAVRVFESELPTAYFSEVARRTAAELGASGERARADLHRYRVHAYPAEPVEQTEPGTSAPPFEFEVEPVAETIALGERALDELLASSDPVGDLDPADAPVFIADPVLREIHELAEAAGDVETGGVLIGRLHRAAGGSEILVEITAQIPARHAEAHVTSFAFTPETWAAADAARALRGQAELMLGWWHSHPFFCRACPPERRRACAFSRSCFSAEDVHLHHTCFSQAWQVALLTSELPEQGRVAALFGWRMGRVVERGFRKLHPTAKENG